MGETGDVVLVLDVLDHIEGLVAASAAGAVGAGDKIRLESGKLGDRIQEVLQALFRFGREELERICSFSLLKNLRFWPF